MQIRLFLLLLLNIVDAEVDDGDDDDVDNILYNENKSNTMNALTQSFLFMLFFVSSLFPAQIEESQSFGQLRGAHWHADGQTGTYIRP